MSRDEGLHSALDLVVLRTVAAIGPQHGLALARRIVQASDGLLHLDQSTLYPALLRLEQRRWIKSRWGPSDSERRAKFYELTTRGRRGIRLGCASTGSLERDAVLPRSAMVVLAATLWSPPSEDRAHVRATEPGILALIDEGRARSATFRRLVSLLDASDVIVYLETKMTQRKLGGYLFDHVGGRGEWRYLRIAVDVHGAHDRVISLVGHELQHAVEVAQAPEVRDADALEQLFSRMAIQFGCGGTTCYETQAAREVEYAVGDELKAARRWSRH